MPKPKPLSAQKLRATFDPEKIPYKDSLDIPLKNRRRPPQPRALMALEVGLQISDPGYNIFVAGDPNLGRMHLVREFLEPKAAKAKAPPDYIYVYNFNDPDRPRSFTLPAGNGKRLKLELAAQIAKIRKEIPDRLEQETFVKKRESLFRHFQNARDELLRKMERSASKQGFNMNMDEQGALTLFPMLKGKVVTEDDFGRLDPGLQKTLRNRGDRILTAMTGVIRKINHKEQGFKEKERGLERQAASEVLSDFLTPLAQSWGKHLGLGEYFESMRGDILENMDRFLPQEPCPPSAHVPESGGEDFFTRYSVNLFVDNAGTGGAPVIVCDHPTPSNLLGCIEREAELGALFTDFTLIKAGALHRANHGFLVLRMEDLLGNPEAWDGLLRALGAGRSKIEDPDGDHDQAKIKTIEPEPIPLHVKVLLIGTDLAYELLLQDDRFQKLFKLKAHLQDTVPRTDASIKDYFHSLARIIRGTGLLPLDKTALAGMVDFSSRVAEDRKKLSLRLPLARDLMVEASALARAASLEGVNKAVLDTAIRNREFRANLYEEEFMDDYDRELIKVATSGKAVGRANGLSVTLFGDYEFGLPHQIACTVGVGHGGILDLEREAELGGPIHTKGMMILKSYLLGLFAQDKPLVLTGSLCFEQSYAHVEGDSASGAELAALLSSLAEVPISLSLAFTGAVSQSGTILSVGAVTRKVEGFFEVCRRRGLSGSQGVIIPADNVAHMMLKHDVIHAIEEGKFHIYPVKTIEQAMEVLTGMPTGRRLKNGKFSRDSLYRRVDERLARLASLADYTPKPRRKR